MSRSEKQSGRCGDRSHRCVYQTAAYTAFQSSDPDRDRFFMRLLQATLITAFVLVAMLAFAGPSSAATTGAITTANSPLPKNLGATITGVKGRYEGHDLQVCALCHADYTKNFLAHNPMAREANPGTPMAVGGKGLVCEVCHGPSWSHVNHVVNGKRPLPPVTFGYQMLGVLQWKVRPGQDSTPVKDQNKVCLTCHTDSNHIHWAGSPHQFNGISCASCHNVMGVDKTLSKRTVAQVCFQCHKDIQADAHKFESHPILEGEVTCTNCHNPHGGNGGPYQLRYMSINQTCFSCHADKRGPFLYEHPPVEQKCTTCHNPHGTSFAYMLRRPVPFLCQECHLSDYHPSTLYGPGTGGLGALGTGTGQPAAQIVGNGCLNCHSHIHGSNNPSGGRWLQ